ncbi:hypothetical protein [Streptomyces sp. NPDC017868]|uniref:hypothetical protein n=1 Tax=Streptomyces sp. NPDC017868 TaxID=3365014 RepID=UPI0037AB596E
MLRFLEDAQASAMTADKAHSGEAADAFRAYFKTSVGLTCPPSQVQEDEPLVANLVTACNEIAKACDRYAEHVEAAEKAIQQHKLDLFAVDLPWDSPLFGGNGFDGGLLDAVLDDPWIRRLGEVGHALDSAEKRVRLPAGGGGRVRLGCRSCLRSSRCRFRYLPRYRWSSRRTAEGCQESSPRSTGTPIPVSRGATRSPRPPSRHPGC